MIKVSVYRSDLTEIDHVFTDEEGRYVVAVAADETVTVRFDTHHSLTNAADWQPSLVANVVTSDSTALDRCLLPAGQDFGAASNMDALNGYVIAAAVGEGEEYAATAVKRLSMLKQPSLVLQGLQNRLLAHFSELT
ncbi:carboxypeptidase regulatory-like domain-containing protein [Streptomyces sp. NBC_00249]|uniref:carboxypeptidase regulatory-like domain-containing protein n=1 Tax=Streptomyces sp. NBC_00249 TaxID=2975690 RepID=UPI002252CEEB|nr:carboxypeptidase regulatory-like domain-containing protein [Streptomyces sp. NBC_00249]MCX5195671.1 carboxypeptidase regulatory-like domain-containing protein [Streptomyces sp. NBC_00249]